MGAWPLVTVAQVFLLVAQVTNHLVQPPQKVGVVVVADSAYSAVVHAHGVAESPSGRRLGGIVVAVCSGRDPSDIPLACDFGSPWGQPHIGVGAPPSSGSPVIVVWGSSHAWRGVVCGAEYDVGGCSCLAWRQAMFVSCVYEGRMPSDGYLGACAYRHGLAASYLLQPCSFVQHGSSLCVRGVASPWSAAVGDSS